MTAPRGRDRPDEEATPAGLYGWMLAIMGAATAACFVFRSALTPTDVAMVLLLGVVFVASRYGRGPAIAASVLGIAAFDFLFVPPYYTFAVADSSFFFTFGVMLLVALIMSGLTATIRQQAIEAREGEMRTAALFALSRELAEAESREAIVAIAARHIGEACGGSATVVVADEAGVQDGVPRWPPGGVFEDPAARVAAAWAFQNGEAAGPGTGHCAVGEVHAAPLRASSRTVGIVAVQPEPTGRVPSGAECRTVQALADQAALALELGTLAQRWERKSGGGGAQGAGILG